MKDLKIEFRWGIIFSLVLMVWMAIEKNVLGWHNEYISGQLMNHFVVTILLYVIVFYLALRQKREHTYHGKISYKRVFLSGAIISVVIALLAPLSQFFIYHYISPHYFDNMIEYYTHKEKFAMTQEGAEKFFNMTSFIFSEAGIGLSLGFVVSAALGFVLRTK